MALKIKITNKSNGATAEYWRIAQFERRTVWNGKAQDTIRVLITGHVSEETRKNSKAPLESHWVRLASSVNQTGEDYRDDLYAALKATDEWKGAKDV